MRTQIKVRGQWTDVLPQSIQRNHLFRVIDEEGKVVPFSDGKTEKHAARDALVMTTGKVIVEFSEYMVF